jgi:hypothetical protein
MKNQRPDLQMIFEGCLFMAAMQVPGICIRRGSVLIRTLPALRGIVAVDTVVVIGFHASTGCHYVTATPVSRINARVIPAGWFKTRVNIFLLRHRIFCQKN